MVVPFRDERNNAAPFVDRLRSGLGNTLGWEALLVDDGSLDGTCGALREASAGDPRIRVLCLESARGQSAALEEGVRSSRALWTAFLDGDLQNDPAEIPRLLALARSKQIDLLVGWRRRRCDPFWTRRLPARIWNALLRTLFRLPVHDCGCALRICRRETLFRTPRRGHWHRLLPLAAHRAGWRVAEEEVRHAPRTLGRSKYGPLRILPALRDLGREILAPRSGPLPR